MERLFGTDGIRAKFGEHPLTRDFIRQIGAALGSILSRRSSNPRLLIGKDTRYSGDELERFLIEGISSYPVEMNCLGILPTAALSYLSREHNADLGIMLSASHNLSEDNGIKLFNSSGLKVSNEDELEIEAVIREGVRGGAFKRPEADKLKIKSIESGQALDSYINFLKEAAGDVDLKGFKVAIDCSHGAVSGIADRALLELGAEVDTLNNEPDGKNINQDCGSQHPEVVARYVAENKMDVGFSFDGDGDRVILIDEKGRVLDGDYILTMLGLNLQKKGKLKKNTLVATVMSNMGLDEAMKEYDIRVLRTAVGDKNVVEGMLREKLNLGGEQSGHIVLLDHSPTGDGILTCLKILALMKESNKCVSELSNCMSKFPQILLNVKVKEKKSFEEIPGLPELLKKNEEELRGSGRMVLRYSGTEPLARIMIEGKNLQMIERMSRGIADIIQEGNGRVTSA
ncbi:MAG: phosphoglucosamine mutase [Candidatus Omnitrophica bacterium]|nr:phosphoglucosamine mutase [Candidatus Omnitrophota bacterium]